MHRYRPPPGTASRQVSAVAPGRESDVGAGGSACIGVSAEVLESPVSISRHIAVGGSADEWGRQATGSYSQGHLDLAASVLSDFQSIGERFAFPSFWQQVREEIESALRSVSA